MLLFSSASAAALETPQPQSTRPAQIAIIIDDVGYSARDGRFFALPYPLTIAVLPDSPFGAGLAEDAAALGKEVMVHLPMQANDDLVPKEQGTLQITMSADEITAQLDHALSQVPMAVGLNNHMGSLATSDIEVMTAVMDELKRRQLFFIDSRTTVDTVAETTARAYAVPTERRHVFLDHEREAAAMQSAWQRLIATAHKNGFAIAIGHPHEATLQLLETNLPLLEAANIEVVFASKLVR